MASQGLQRFVEMVKLFKDTSIISNYYCSRHFSIKDTLAISEFCLNSRVFLIKNVIVISILWNWYGLKVSWNSKILNFDKNFKNIDFGRNFQMIMVPLIIFKGVPAVISPVKNEAVIWVTLRIQKALKNWPFLIYVNILEYSRIFLCMSFE